MYLLGFVLVIKAAIFYSVSCDLSTSQDSQIKAQQGIDGYFEGCYSDSHNSLTASGTYHQRFAHNTNSICVKLCKEKGFAVASTRGQDCYCSNSLPVPALHFSRDKKAAGNGGPCSTLCPGAFVGGNCQGDECCGGTSAFSVYIVGHIDILKELINRIAINFENNPTKMHNAILTTAEKNLLNCQCFNGEITLYLTAKALSSDGKTSDRTVKSIIDIANHHTVEETGHRNDLQKIELVATSLEKLLQTNEPVLEEPFGNWDLLCDNYFGGGDLNCQKNFQQSAGFSETYSTEHGVNIGVKFAIEVTTDALFAKSKKTFETSAGYSYTRGYSKTSTTTRSEGFSISQVVAKGTKGEVRFFKSEIPVKIKWRAHFFADGDVLIDYGGVGIKKTIHLSRLLGYDQRKLFALGTINYGDRPTIIARTRTVDRQGNIVSENVQSKMN